MLTKESKVKTAGVREEQQKIRSDEFRTTLREALKAVSPEQLAALINCSSITPERLRDWAGDARPPLDEVRQIVMHMAKPSSEILKSN